MYGTLYGQPVCGARDGITGCTVANDFGVAPPVTRTMSYASKIKIIRYFDSKNTSRLHLSQIMRSDIRSICRKLHIDVGGELNLNQPRWCLHLEVVVS